VYKRFFNTRNDRKRNPHGKSGTDESSRKPGRKKSVQKLINWQIERKGINSKTDIERVQKVNVNAVLVGESLVTASDPGMKLREFV